MLYFQVKKEIAQQVISAKFAVLTLLVISLSLISVIVMHRDFQLRTENYEVLKPTGDATVAVKRPVLMSTLIKGLDERMGRSITVSLLGMLEVGTSQSAANRLFALFRELDLHFVALVVMSLAAILFSFDMVSREKRRGTLKLMLANGLSRSRVLLAKWLGALIVVAIPAAIGVLICLLYLQFGTGTALDADFYARSGLFFLLVLFYLAVFVSLGLLISCLTHRPAVSLVFAILVWALLIFVVPNTAATASGIITGDKTLAQREVNVRHFWTTEIFKAINDPRLGSSDYNPWDDAYRNSRALLSAEYNDYMNQAVARVGWAKALSYISPAGPFSFASWALAGTGPEDSIDFKRQVLRYKTGAVEDAGIFQRIARKDPSAPKNFKASIFKERTRTLGEAFFEEVVPAAGVLTLMIAVLFAAGFFAFVRYDVR